MAWVKLDDAMPHHPKVLAAGVEAFALDVAGIAYCNRYETDGFIAEASLAAVLPNLRSPVRVAARLVEADRWERTSDGWLIHDYAEFQPSSSAKDADRAAARDRMRAVRANKSRTGSDGSDEHGENTKRSSDYPGPGPVPEEPAAATDGFSTFHVQRAAAEVKRRQTEGLRVKNAGGLRKSIIDDDEFRAESERLWAHRDCLLCRGSGFTEAYAPGAGQVKTPCQEVVQ